MTGLQVSGYIDPEKVEYACILVSRNSLNTVERSLFGNSVTVLEETVTYSPKQLRDKLAERIVLWRQKTVDEVFRNSKLNVNSNRQSLSIVQIRQTSKSKWKIFKFVKVSSSVLSPSFVETLKFFISKAAN